MKLLFHYNIQILMSVLRIHTTACNYALTLLVLSPVSAIEVTDLPQMVTLAMVNNIQTLIIKS